MNPLRKREAGAPDPRDAEISRLRREVAALREREDSARAEAQDARKHFADLTAMSKRFASSMRVGVGERHQQRRHLAAQYAISQVLAGARNLEEAAPKIYRILGERLGWHVGVLWRVEEAGYDDEDDVVLRGAGAWHSSSSSRGALEATSEGATFRHGEGLPGRVWERGEPVWVEDFLADGETARVGAAAEDGLRGALAFPIHDGDFVGVFELFRREVLSPDEDLMRTAELVGGQIAQFLERRRAEEERDLALAREREARERAIGILESIDDAFFTLDEEQRFTYANRRAEELWGRTREELMGKSFWEVFPATVGSEYHRAVEKALKEGEATEYEAVSTIIGIWVSGRIYPSPGGISVLFHSIEGRKQAEEAARQSRERANFRAALSDALRPLEDPAEIQAEAVRVLGRHLGVDRAVYAEVQANDEHCVAVTDFADGVPGLAGRRSLRSFGPAAEARARAGGNVAVADVEAGRLDETEREAYASMGIRAFLSVPVSKGSRPAAFLIVHQSEPRPWTTDDISLVEETAEKLRTAVEGARAQGALRESENRYRSLVTATSSIVWIATPANGCVEEVPSWEAYTGQTFEEYRGFGWLDAVHPDDTGLASAWTEAEPGDDPIESEFRLRRRDGEYRRVVRAAAPTPPAGTRARGPGRPRGGPPGG